MRERESWRKRWEWERVIVSIFPPSTNLLIFYISLILSPLSLLLTSLSQHPMSWRYSWIVMNNYLNTCQLFLTIDNLALSTLGVKWGKFVDFHGIWIFKNWIFCKYSSVSIYVSICKYSLLYCGDVDLILWCREGLYCGVT